MPTGSKDRCIQRCIQRWIAFKRDRWWHLLCFCQSRQGPPHRYQEALDRLFHQHPAPGPCGERTHTGQLHDIARLTSCNTSLSFGEWSLLHKSRLGILPLFGTIGLAAPKTKCRRCKEVVESTSHVTSHCRNNLPAIGRRHDLVLAEIVRSHVPRQQSFWELHTQARHSRYYS
jgi:hypothetical protein